jgi:hypothetical protein
MKSPKKYSIEGEDLTFDEIQAQVVIRFPETSKSISSSLLRYRLQRTTKWDRLGECIKASRERSRSQFRRSLNKNKRDNP